MLSRRELLFATVASVLLPHGTYASNQKDKAAQAKTISWTRFHDLMTKLAAAEKNHTIAANEIAELGMSYLQRLDITSAEFKQAVDESYESGNRYWLWNRMIKEPSLNGGILTIDSKQLVQLHDHPGATGMVRIISGEAEVWQFDAIAQQNFQQQSSEEVNELVRVSRRILTPGDTAVVQPDNGNIHALRAVSSQCSMLDFFIPPYENNLRSWYLPLQADWFDREKVVCRKVSQRAYMDA